MAKSLAPVPEMSREESLSDLARYFTSVRADYWFGLPNRYSIEFQKDTAAQANDENEVLDSQNERTLLALAFPVKKFSLPTGEEIKLITADQFSECACEFLTLDSPNQENEISPLLEKIITAGLSKPLNEVVIAFVEQGNLSEISERIALGLKSESDFFKAVVSRGALNPELKEIDLRCGFIVLLPDSLLLQEESREIDGGEVGLASPTQNCRLKMFLAPALPELLRDSKRKNETWGAIKDAKAWCKY